MTLRGYQVELDPNNFQRTAFRRYAGAARFVWNWALGECIRDYEEKKAADLEGVKVKGTLMPYDLDSHLPVLKVTTHLWMADISAQVLKVPLRQLQKTYQTFFKNIREGKNPGFPKFKRKEFCRTSFQFPQYTTLTSSSIKLPKIGRVRLKERDYIPTDRPVKTVTIFERAGRWYASVLIEDVEPTQVDSLLNLVIGIDLGVKTLATLSDGTLYENPKHLEASQKSLKKLSRRLSRQKKGSNRRAKTKARLARVHARVANQRLDAIHKMTSEVVKTKRPSVIVIEDLNVKGMTKNHRLARAVSGASFGEIRRQLTYKTSWYGVRLIVADRFFPSSKICSGCGVKKDVLSLSDRTYCCDVCGLVIDRDENAAINLRRYGEHILAGGTPVTARGGIVRPTELALKADLIEARTDLRAAS